MTSVNRTKIVVVGSVNLDITARVSRLPVPGETVSDAAVQRFPGGKGANQALAAQRLGAEVSLVACVGDDIYADDALALLRQGGVDLSQCQSSASMATGIAMIVVAESGENQIVVAPGANFALQFDPSALPVADALICQLEVPVNALVCAADVFKGFFCINLAPARAVPTCLIQRADLVVVNETEAAFYGDKIHETKGIVVITLGARGATAYQNSRVLATCGAPSVDVLDTTGAGDTFTAALVVALAARLPLQPAMEFACIAGALATTQAGAQPSLPFEADVIAFDTSAPH